MECPECEAKTVVLESREFAGAVYRRRKCKECGFRFTTEETETENTELMKEAWKYQMQRYRKNKK